MILTPLQARFSAFLLFMVSSMAVAPASAQHRSSENHLVASLDASKEIIPGETLILGMTLTIDEDWHTYWPGVNDTGYGVSIDFEPVEGLNFHSPVFPTPRRYLADGNILDHIYEGEILILVPVSVEDNFEAGNEITLAANVDYLICKQVCIPESTTVSRTIQSRKAPPTSRRAFTEFEIAYIERPMPVGDYSPVANDPTIHAAYIPHLEWKDDQVTLAFEGASHSIFFPDTNCTQPADLIAQGESESDSITITFDRQYDDDPSSPARLSGRLRAKFSYGWRDFDIDYTQPLKQETKP